MHTQLKNGLIAFFTLVVFQEIAFRIAFPLPELSNFDRAKYVPGSSEEQSFAFYRNSNWYWESSLDTNHQFLHELNQYGFRDKEWEIEKKRGKKRVLLIGDSFLEGIMADQSQTISMGFKTADKQEHFEIMNMGVMGVGLNSYLRMIADAAPIFKPDVICVMLYSNDMTDKFPIIPTLSLQPKYYNKYRPRILEILSQKENQTPLHSRFNKEEKPFLPSAKERNFPWFNRENVLYKNVTIEVANTMLDGSTNPFKLNQILREQEGLSKDLNLIKMFTFLSKFGSQYQTKFVVCYIPARHQVTNHYYQYDRVFCKRNCPEKLDLTIPFYNRHQVYLEKLCAKHQINFIDFTNLIREKEQAQDHLYWKYDDHMKGKGYQLLGKSLFDQLSNQIH